jgi:predicted lipid carrier protein YhbT
MNHIKKITTSPRLPRFFATPFRLIPGKLHSQLIVAFLNRLVAAQLAEGDLDFLEGRGLSIKVTDINITFNISLSQARLVKTAADKNCDLMIEASAYDFLMLAARQEDPDTLVFQRRLIMQGDTELGLELKNFLDGLDIESTASFSVIDSLLQKSLPVYRHLLS